MRSGDEIPERDRSSILAAIAVLAVLGTTVSSGVVTAQSAPQGTDEFAVIQGDECFSIDPLGDGSQSVEEFYDYRTPSTDPSSYSYSSFGTVHLQEDDTSSLFLYEGTNGLSLVLIHGQYDGDSPGGAVTMQFEGLPRDGEWVVEDDSYDGRDDEFSHNGPSSRITWVYTDGRSDGAAFRGGLSDEFDIAIDPAFNDAADFRLYDGEITEWQVLSATDDGYERTPIATNQSIEITSGGCASHAVTGVETDGAGTAGEAIDITATVENDGEQPLSLEVPFTVDGETVDERAVTVEPGEVKSLSTAVTLDEGGTYTVGAADETTTVAVDDSDETLPAFGLTVATLVVLSGALIVRYRQ
jgi:hypothetical protein